MFRLSLYNVLIQVSDFYKLNCLCFAVLLIREQMAAAQSSQERAKDQSGDTKPKTWEEEKIWLAEHQLEKFKKLHKREVFGQWLKDRNDSEENSCN